MPRNQILLRLASVELLDSDGREIEFAIKRVLTVNEPSKANKAKFPDPSQGGSASTFPSATELQQLQTDLHSQREDIRRIDSNGFRIVSALDKRADRIQGDVMKLRGTVPGLQRDIGTLQKELGSIKVEVGKARAFAQNSAALVGLEDRLVSVTSTAREVGEQLATLNDQFQKEIGKLRSELGQQQQEMEDLKSEVRGSVSVEDHAQDVVNLRAEMAQLRRERDETRAHETTRAHAAFPPRELEVLTSNIAKIGNRASQVETLQMELEILKGRVERTEASRQGADNCRPIRTIDAGGLAGYSDMYSAIRKRAASPDLEPVPKRPASSLGYPEPPDRRYATPLAWSALPTATNEENLPEKEGTTHTPNSAKRGRKSPRGCPPSTSSGVSTRLRKR